MGALPVPILVVIAFFGGVCVIFGILGYWKQQYLKRGINLTLAEMCGLSLRKMLKDDLLDALELANENKFFVKFHYLEAHMTAGGSAYNLIKIIVDGKNKGKEISFREAATMDLGKVTLEEAKQLYADHDKK